MKFKYLLAASAVSLAATGAMVATPAAAQQITSTVQGTVQDEAGAPVAGATVTVTDTRTGATRTLTTGVNGGFNAANLVTGGPYTVSASADGYEGQTVEGVNTNVSGATELTFTLTSGSGVIVVTGSRVRVTQLAVGPGTGFGTAIIEESPTFDRDVRDIIRLDPRVTLDADTSSGQNRISCLGGNDRSNAFTVDAISQGDLYGLNGNGFASRSSTPIPYSAIRETSVEFAPFDVEYGQFTGCAINVITRSGGNDFHGSAFYEYSDNGLRGKDVAGEETNPVEAQKNYGVSLGGPIIPDRLFFFGAYSHQESGEAWDFGPSGGGYANETPGISVEDFNRFSQILRDQYGIEAGPLVYNLPYENDRYFGRLDLQINDDHRLEATYQRLEENTVKRDGIFSSISSPTITGLNNFYNSGTKSDYYSARLYSDWSDNFSTELRYAHSQIDDLQDPVGGGEAQSDNPLPQINVGTYDADSDIYGGFQAGPGYFRMANQLNTTVDYATAIARIDAGNHNFKLGATWNQVGIFNLFVPGSSGVLNFANLDDFEAGILTTGSRDRGFFGFNLYNNRVVGATGASSATGDVNDAAADFTRTTWSFFAQDDWDMTDRLNAVIGVRVDLYDGDAPAYNPNFAERYGRSNAIGFSNLPVSFLPRAAFTYDLGDVGPLTGSSLRLGAGIFSGGDPLVWFGNAFQNNGITYSEGNLGSSACDGVSNDVYVGGVFTGVPQCVFADGQAEAANGQADTQSIDPDIKTPSVLRFNLGFESGLDFADAGFLSNWRFKTDFIYSAFKNPFTIADLSQVVANPIDAPGAGLNGYTIDGRPIYRAIDPTVDGCTAEFQGNNPGPVYTNVNLACFNTRRDNELILTNADGFDSWTASFILSKSTSSGIITDGGGVDFLVGYAYTDANDRRAMTSSTAGSNYDRTLAFDLQNPAEATSIYSNTHNITARLSIAEEFIPEHDTRFTASFTARSGRHYGLAFNGGGIFNDSTSGSDNALLYIPTGISDPNVSPDSDMDAVADLAEFAAGLDCAKDYAGRTIARNTCENDWYFDMDLKLSQNLPGPGSFFGLDDSIQVYGMIDNFLNMLDGDWNVLRSRQYAGQQGVADIDGIDDQGRYIISGFNGVEEFEADNQLYTPASVWRIKVGVSYKF
ncbi:TonB-dependent receptor [Qipengyuania sp. 1NDH17]|uniref:TonB-dependent receptor n=1 Tax=Qipengyuania polymorpha TaxID=2867234 RepID=A0ABS7IXM2_9SPHN|nr:TonB-dependent receptor [Qipengyuania polymorpha]MBX7458299.1 TonB-dependent receptor [Qipengyuania polymorpha]